MSSRSMIVALFGAAAMAQQYGQVTTTTTPYPAGSTLPDGGYVCNPAHSYPAGVTCDGSGATPTLKTLTGAASTTTPAGVSKTSAVGTYTGAAAMNNVPVLGGMALAVAAFAL